MYNKVKDLQLHVRNEQLRAWPVGKAAWRGRLFEAGNVGRCGEMGIRFYCSGCGEKLNIKAFQAGRRGLCPYCGASIDIPTKSTRPSSKRRRPRQESPPGHDPTGGGGLTRQPPARSPAGPPAGAQPDQGPGATPTEPLGQAPPITPAQTPTAPLGQPAASLSPAGQPTASPSPLGQPTSLPSSIGSPGADAPLQTTSATSANPPDAAGAQAYPASAPSPSPSPAQTDPLAQSPDAVWYVRPASGGQFGPATSDLMRTWIAEGRVGPNSLVWQEGWRDWQQAAEVFPPLASGQLESELGAVGTSGGASTGAPTRGYDRPSRSRSVALNAAIIAALILAVAALLGIFLWVLKGGPERQGDASTRAPTSVASAVHGPPAERSIPAASGHHGA